MNGRALTAAAGVAAGTVFLAGLFLATSKRSRAAAQPAGPSGAIVNTLDRICQEKFQTIDYQDFGVSRIALPVKQPSHPGLRRFVPKTDFEKAIVADARSEGWDAVLFVAGRSAQCEAGSSSSGSVDASPDAAAPAVGHPTYRDLSQGAILTGVQPHAGLPARRELLAQAANAFRAFKTDPVYQFSTGAWTVVARPVRAEKAECVNCHQGMDRDRSMKVGDVLGVAMYAFAPTTER